MNISRAMRHSGFTLIELLIVIVVIAILALIIIPRVMGASRRAEESTLKNNLQQLRARPGTVSSRLWCIPEQSDRPDRYPGQSSDFRRRWRRRYRRPYSRKLL